MAIPGTSIGKSQVSQIISALEHHRFHHQHEYRAIAEAQINLRTDNRIWVFETASKHNEPKRAAMAQVLKAAGSSAGGLPAAYPSRCLHELTYLCLTPDTYTTHQLVQCSMWCLTNYTAGPRQVFIGIRDRAMLLLSTASAFRGDSSRMLLWSDLFKSSVHLGDVELDAEVPVSTLFFFFLPIYQVIC